MINVNLLKLSCAPSTIFNFPTFKIFPGFLSQNTLPIIVNYRTPMPSLVVGGEGRENTRNYRF